MNNVQVIGLGYKARHGKNFLAKMIRKQIIRQTDGDCIEMTFAADLKAVARVIFGQRKKNGKLLQVLGTNVWREHVDPDIWVECLMSQIEDVARDLAPDEKGVILVPDMRFPNELAAIKSVGGKTVRVTRFNDDGSIYHPNDGRDPNHPSETQLDGAEFDYVVEAKTGDFAALESARDQIVAAICRWVGPPFYTSVLVRPYPDPILCGKPIGFRAEV